METSEIITVKNSRKAYICDWCGELIPTKTSYKKYFTYGENVTTRLHLECCNAMMKADLDDFLPLRGMFARGCYCGENRDQCFCTHA